MSPPKSNRLLDGLQERWDNAVVDTALRPDWHSNTG